MSVPRSSRMPILTLAAAGMLAAAVLVARPATTAAADSAHALHLRLVRARPGVDSTVAGSPTQICLWFSERVNLKATAVTITDPAGKAVKLSPLTLDTAAKAPVVAKVLQPMAPGRYTVSWRAMGRDSHIVKNTYSFTLVAAKPGTGE